MLIYKFFTFVKYKPIKMAQKPLKKIKVHKKPTKYFKRSDKDKTEDFKITKEINKKNFVNIEEMSKKKRTLSKRKTK